MTQENDEFWPAMPNVANAVSKVTFQTTAIDLRLKMKVLDWRDQIEA